MMIRLPLTEGRAENLDLFSIYSDVFILYCYAVSIPFLLALYKTFILLGDIGKNEAFSLKSVAAFTNIKYCAILLSMFIVVAGLYILIFHDKNDDPAGFLAICMLAAYVSPVIAIAVALFEKTCNMVWA